MTLELSRFAKDNNEERLMELMDLSSTPYIQNAADVFDPSTAVNVSLNRAAVTCENAEYNGLGATQLTTSMAVLAHNPDTKAVGLANLSSEGDVVALSSLGKRALITLLNEIGGENIEIRIVGPSIRGIQTDDFINDVLDILSSYHCKVLSADFRGKDSSRDIAVKAGKWDEGLVRGTVNSFGLIANGAGSEETKRQRAELVKLNTLVSVSGRATQSGLVYDGRQEVSLTPVPEIC